MSDTSDALAGPNDANVAAFIQANLPLVPVPSIPELRLHKAGPSSGLWRLAEADEQGFESPYWAHYWGGGLALARHVLDRPETVAGRSVLDLGTGSGIVAIAAAKAGACAVIAADVDRYAVVAARLNAEANSVAVTVVAGDLTTGPPPPVDLVLVGDLFYDAALARRVTAFLDRCLDAGIAILIGDPWRDHLPRARLHRIADYDVAETGDGGAGRTKPAAVFSLLPGRE
ncbi:methyltransferase [Sphingomonas sp. So64.6b]|uniref:class I SAM-dependent methyltransferase n=1 Tax=Sphingomonas sp. So64.6b TaxID=2997354 RepID=UPI0018618776|nr:50S ribosomal protein L11 methyltransferase [Sphingomonas sp. So64.6b]QNA85188.1 methyltransferase [Sphingomonas sp. So64.6b]